MSLDAGPGREVLLDSPRRIVALILPQLFLHAAGAQRAEKSGARPPQAVVLLPAGREQIEPGDQLVAVDEIALKKGVRAGQTVTEACAFVSGLRVLPLEPPRVFALLLELAEVLRPFSASVALASPDGLFLDVTGIAHLHGGEAELCQELSARARELGHASQVAISSGPRIAEAVARFGRLDVRGIRIVPPGEEARSMRELPLRALMSASEAAWFARLGLLEVAQLLELPASTVTSRLGPDAPRILAWARGQDDEPLIPCEFPRDIEISLEWEEGLVGLEPLLFVLRGVASRLGARLQGRGEAASFIELRLEHDPSISRYRGGSQETKLTFELSSPIHRDVEFERVLRTRLERTNLPAPTVGLTLRASQLCAQVLVQLELGTRGASRRLQDLPVLLSELQTDVGEGNLGILSIQDAHAPEARGRLLPLGPRGVRSGGVRSGGVRSGGVRSGGSGHRAKQQKEASSKKADPLARATRLFQEPVLLPVPLRVGESFVLGQGYYTIEKLEFATRLDGVAWWTNTVQSRDYVWAWLSGSSGGLQALLFVDRRSRHAYVQGLAD